MKQIVAINASPRKEWNTGTLIREARASVKISFLFIMTNSTLGQIWLIILGYD